MRLALRGANPAEWLALRVGIVPTAAAEAWGGMALSAVVITAVQTGIAARLAQQPATAAELAADLELDPVPTRLLLDCLRSGGHVRVRRGRYRLTRSARRWLGPESPLSVARYVAGSADYWSWWAQLDEVTRTGRPTGHHAVEPDDPYWHRYIRGQADLARLSAGEVAKKLRLPENSRTLLDLGGGHGWYSAQLCRRHPYLHATVLDLPGSAAVGREVIAEAGLSHLVVHREGDVTTADLGQGFDAVLCFNLLHHLSSEQIVHLFRRVHQALAPGGVFAVMDAFAEPGRRASAQANVLSLFVYLSSGAQIHPPQQLHDWLSAAGFGAPRRIPILRIPGQALYVVSKRDG